MADFSNVTPLAFRADLENLDAKVPDPEIEPDDRFLTTVNGALVYADAPEGGGGGDEPTPDTVLGLDRFRRPGPAVGTADTGQTWTALDGSVWSVNNNGWVTCDTVGASGFGFLRFGDPAPLDFENPRALSARLAGNGGLLLAYIDPDNFLRVHMSTSRVLSVIEVWEGVSTTITNAALDGGSGAANDNSLRASVWMARAATVSRVGRVSVPEFANTSFAFTWPKFQGASIGMGLVALAAGGKVSGFTHTEVKPQ